MARNYPRSFWKIGFLVLAIGIAAAIFALLSQK